MGQVLTDEEIEIEITHSKLGVLSTIISFMLFSYLSALYLVFITYDKIKFKTFDSTLNFSQSMQFPLSMAICAAGIGNVIALLGLLGKYKKRFYPVGGLILNSSIIYFAYQFIQIVKKL